VWLLPETAYNLYSLLSITITIVAWNASDHFPPLDDRMGL